jgi:hypothetical protein
MFKNMWTFSDNGDLVERDQGQKQLRNDAEAQIQEAWLRKEKEVEAALRIKYGDELFEAGAEVDRLKTALRAYQNVNVARFSTIAALDIQMRQADCEAQLHAAKARFDALMKKHVAKSKKNP